ncbi:hypothetical protein [Serratia symbiotica]|uniref:hypothetical protein n=1 Tax=Serratia symbiotica TaxID=138074 RepID=UPI001CF0BF1C|nr:hypothetical protein [Serratia symbiotica]
MKTGSYAVVKTGETKVDNIIVADDSLSLEGYDLIRFTVDGDDLCQIGMFYNEKDGKFYDDESFATIGGINAENH